MRAIPTALPGVLILEPKVFGDARGFFMETYNTRVFGELTGCHRPFVQDNHSRSARGVLRGLHYQLPPKAQDKLVRVIAGEIFDVAVDLRQTSATFGRWVGAVLSDENHHQLWIPPGFAHGFYVLSAAADVAYKCTAQYFPEHDRALRWDDPRLAIAWPLAGRAAPLLSARDAAAPGLDLAEVYP